VLTRCQPWALWSYPGCGLGLICSSDPLSTGSSGLSFDLLPVLQSAHTRGFTVCTCSVVTDWAVSSDEGGSSVFIPSQV
jgi:hypothetical protein